LQSIGPVRRMGRQSSLLQALKVSLFTQLILCLEEGLEVVGLK